MFLGFQAVAVDIQELSLYPVVLAWEDLELKVYTGDATAVKTVVHKCSGTFMPSEFVAIMGPSGAGASPFLHPTLPASQAYRPGAGNTAGLSISSSWPVCSTQPRKQSFGLCLKSAFHARFQGRDICEVPPLQQLNRPAMP